MGRLVTSFYANGTKSTNPETFGPWNAETLESKSNRGQLGEDQCTRCLLLRLHQINDSISKTNTDRWLA